VFRVVVFALLAIGMVSSYRAYFQVWSLELSAPRVLSAGTVVKSEVVTSGRTAADVEVDLIQDTHSERLLKLHLGGNEFGFFDPRSKHASDSITLTSEMLSKFQPAPRGFAPLPPVVTSGCVSRHRPSASSKWKFRSNSIASTRNPADNSPFHQHS
jgi:hypothetical protein